MTNNETSEKRYMKEESIVIAMDLGTTNSAVSFSYLYPGTVPTVQMVSKWPGQREASGDPKVPSIIAYRSGHAVACGDMALEYEADADYEVAKWFKLHLHPESIKVSNKPPAYSTDHPPQIEIPPLPRNVTLKQVYADLMKYLIQGTRNFFQNTTPNGALIWKRLESRIIIALCIPNAWDMSQQNFLRKAVLEAGLVKEAQADSLIEFVTEGEASVHYALKYANGDIWLRKGAMFAVTDAGGSTVDSTLYECKEIQSRIVLEEVCGSECIQAGGVFVDRTIRETLKEMLKHSKFSEEEMLELMVDEFESRTKRLFDGSENLSTISFGRSSDNDAAHGIVKGKISLTRADVENCFKSSVEGILESCMKLLSGRKIKHLLLVGGFGESPYLQKSLKEKFSSQGTQIVTVPELCKKASAEGALIWYIRQLVVARAARFTIGIWVHARYNPSLALHQERKHTVITGPDGYPGIFDIFRPLVRKDIVVHQDMQEIFRYEVMYREFPDDLAEFTVDIHSWEGPGETAWFTDENGDLLPQMRCACLLKADLSRMIPVLQQKAGKNGRRYWSVDFQIVLELGRTQLQARLQWKEGAKTCQGPMTIIPGSLF